MEYLYIIQQALVWIITIFWLYQIIVSICSLVKLKEKPILEEKNNRFMAIIPAHNESNVIKNLVESLKRQDYPKELYDIYVIADNCTDDTAKIAKDASASKNIVPAASDKTGIKKALRILPSKETEGFFVARLRKISF